MTPHIPSPHPAARSRRRVTRVMLRIVGSLSAVVVATVVVVLAAGGVFAPAT